MRKSSTENNKKYYRKWSSVNMKVTVFWTMIQYNILESNQSVGGACGLRFQDISLIYKGESVNRSQMVVKQL
jgi:S-methylmethionine-dependent homocysteine/selenocysteine methylase